MFLNDQHKRTHRYLRLSVTDKCNLHCIYCKPIQSHLKKDKSQLLTFDEIERLVSLFVSEFHFNKIRLTGGEPFSRKNIDKLIIRLNALKCNNYFELTATTNGTNNYSISYLKSIGFDRLNFSLDTLQRHRFAAITGRDLFENVIRNINLAISLELKNIKVNTVIMRGINDDELNDFVRFALDKSITVRFIEYMPFNGTGYSDKFFISADDMKTIIQEQYQLIPIESLSGATSQDYQIHNHIGKIGFISSMSKHFCGNCDRIRITSDGKLKTCLFSYSKNDLDLLNIIRSGENDYFLIDAIKNHLIKKELQHPDVNELKRIDNRMFRIGG